MASRRLYLTQQRQAWTHWRSRWQALNDYARRALAEGAERIAALELESERRLAFDQLRLGLTEKVLQWKEVRLAETLQADAESEREQEQLAAAAATESRRLEAERAALKAQVEAFRAERAHRAEAEAATAAAAEAEAEEVRAEAAVVNAERVAYRRQLEVEREARAQAAAEAEAALAAAREERLAALRATVQVFAEADFDRLSGHTNASYAQAVEAHERRLDIARTADGPAPRHMQRYGFSADDIAGDKRLRLEAMMRSQGISGSAYAREALKRVAPPTAPRRDHISTVFEQRE